jgi:hypothetical protein
MHYYHDWSDSSPPPQANHGPISSPASTSNSKHCSHIHLLPAYSQQQSTQPPVTDKSTMQSPVALSLTLAQSLKLEWHQRLNHINFDQLNTWMRNGRLKVPQEVISAPAPVCPACAYGKAKRRPHTTCTSPIAGNHTKPGDGVSADQLEAGCPGLIPTSKGSPISTRYHYCNVWVDHHSRLIFLTMHQRKDSLQAAARTILLHAMSRWSDIISEAFGPFALQHAANLYNHTARDGATASPWELFTGEASTRNLKDYHVFGSPVYVLHKALQDHPCSAPKWQSRCWQGVYLGHSAQHAGNVALVYNPKTLNQKHNMSHHNFIYTLMTVLAASEALLHSRSSQ